MRFKTKPPVIVPIEGNYGWGKPGNSKRFHYFVGGKSLCGVWKLFFGALARVHDVSNLDCKDCAEKVGNRLRRAGLK